MLCLAKDSRIIVRELWTTMHLSKTLLDLDITIINIFNTLTNLEHTPDNLFMTLQGLNLCHYFYIFDTRLVAGICLIMGFFYVGDFMGTLGLVWQCGTQVGNLRLGITPMLYPALNHRH